jgi:hypothetical protein
MPKTLNSLYPCKTTSLFRLSKAVFLTYMPGSILMVLHLIRINLNQSTVAFPNADPVACVNVVGTAVPISDSITTLGVLWDNRLPFTRHVKSLVMSCNCHIRALRHINAALTDHMAKAVSTSLVSSRPDYCNSLLHGCSKANIGIFRRVQNSLARIVTNCYTRSTSASQLLYNLHWLPIKHRIDFKIATFLQTSSTPPAFFSF